MPPRGVKKGRSERGSTSTSRARSRAGEGREDMAEEIAARTVNKERARSGEAATSSRLSKTDISSGRRGGLRSNRKGLAAALATNSTKEARARNIRGGRDDQGPARPRARGRS